MLRLGIGIGASFLGGRLGITLQSSVAAASLLREANGTVTILSLGPVWTPTLTRQANGTVTVSE